VKNLLNPIQKIGKGYEWYKLEFEREKKNEKIIDLNEKR
jgi:hypothetical protein